jgi:hypothetical protein
MKKTQILNKVNDFIHAGKPAKMKKIKHLQDMFFKYNK